MGDGDKFRRRQKLLKMRTRVPTASTRRRRSTPQFHIRSPSAHPHPETRVLANTVPMGELGYCPFCERMFHDAISHFLLNHPHSAVPLRTVLDWIDHSSNRCSQCYMICDDVVLHFEIHHVPSAALKVRLRYNETVIRGDNGTFTCPWCLREEYYSVLFEVCLDRGLSPATLPVTHPPQQHVAECPNNIFVFGPDASPGGGAARRFRGRGALERDGAVSDTSHSSGART